MVWHRSISIVRVTIPSHFLQVTLCQQHWEKLRGEKKKKLNSYSGPAANLGPITDWAYVKAAGLTDREHGWKNLGFFQQATVMWGSHLHLHKLWAKYETISKYKPIICGWSESMCIHRLLKRSMGGGVFHFRRTTLFGLRKG